VGAVGHKLWNRLVAALEAAARQRHVQALRDGMIGVVPVILVGSCFLLLGSFAQVLKQYSPTMAATAWGQAYQAAVPLLLIPYRLTMGLLGLYVTFTVAQALAKQYNLPQSPQALGAVAALLLTDTPIKVGDDWTIPMKPLGPDGIFLGLILAISMVELSRLMRGKPKPADAALEEAIPPAVLEAFRSFLPMLLMIFLVWVLRHLLGIDLQSHLQAAMSPLERLGDSLLAVLIINFLLHLFGVAGIHGISVINAVMLPVWLKFLAENAAAHDAHQVMPHITAFPFYQWFVWIGGAGATLAPTVLLLFSRNPHLRRISRLSLVPAMFNMNEPLIFGIPIVANPVLAIPFIAAPLCCGVTAFLAFSANFIDRPFAEVPWVMPCFLGAPLCSADPRALLLLLVNFCISAAIWWPFLHLYERRIRPAKDSESPEPKLAEL
jgi:PTS system cellobiose-specific IIC component